MPERGNYSYSGLIIAAFMLAGTGWIGLYIVTSSMLPTLWPRWLFYFLGTMALTGTALPFVWLLHRRFDTVPAPPGVLHRQASLIGLLGAIYLWLQLNRILTMSLAIILASGIVLLETLIRRVERSLRRLP